MSSVMWMIAFMIAKLSSPEVKEIVAGIALAILIFGLLYFSLSTKCIQTEEYNRVVRMVRPCRLLISLKDCLLRMPFQSGGGSPGDVAQDRRLR